MTPDRKNKRTPDEILEAIEEQAAADEADRILALSDEALDHELAQAGFDPKAVRERGRRIGEPITARADPESMGGGAWVSEPPPARDPSAPRWAWLAASALAAVFVGGGAIVAATQNNIDKLVNPQDAGLTAAEMSRAIREMALKECDAKNWDPCRDGLTRARELEPTGDADARVRKAWEAMADALRAPAPQPEMGDKPLRSKP
jgi:hypothetical protein